MDTISLYLSAKHAERLVHDVRVQDARIALHYLTPIMHDGLHDTIRKLKHFRVLISLVAVEAWGVSSVSRLLYRLNCPN